MSDKPEHEIEQKIRAIQRDIKAREEAFKETLNPLKNRIKELEAELIAIRSKGYELGMVLYPTKAYREKHPHLKIYAYYIVRQFDTETMFLEAENSGLGQPESYEDAQLFSTEREAESYS